MADFSQNEKVTHMDLALRASVTAHTKRRGKRTALCLPAIVAECQRAAHRGLSRQPCDADIVG
jgi:hypothetical protein